MQNGSSTSTFSDSSDARLSAEDQVAALRNAAFAQEIPLVLRIIFAQPTRSDHRQFPNADDWQAVVEKLYGVVLAIDHLGEAL